MINGLDPILIFHIYNKPKQSFIGPLNEFDTAIADIQGLVGIPIPIPLNERLTGVIVDNESRSITAVTNVTPTTDKDPLSQETAEPEVTQTAVDSEVTVNLLASRDSVVLTAILAMADVIMSKLVTAEYGITYLNGSTVIFNGLLNRFSTNVNRNDTLVRIDFTLSNAKKSSPIPAAGPAPIARVTGEIPLAG